MPSGEISGDATVRVLGLIAPLVPSCHSETVLVAPSSYRLFATIAVVPAGYADGLDTRLSGRGVALVRGRRMPIVGAVSMDMLTVDVTGLDVNPGDEVVLIGRQGDEEITLILVDHTDAYREIAEAALAMEFLGMGVPTVRGVVTGSRGDRGTELEVPHADEREPLEATVHAHESGD